MTQLRQRFRLGALGLLAGILLSACGGWSQPPAAVVNGHEITQAALVHAVTLQLSQAQGAAPGGTAEQARSEGCIVLRETGPAAAGTRPDEVVVGLSPAFAREIWAALNGMTVGECECTTAFTSGRAR